MDDDIDIPWTAEELEAARKWLDQPGLGPVLEAVRILLRPIVAQLIKRKAEG